MQATRQTQRCAVNGGEVEYEDRGRGEPVLLIHGAHIAGSYLPMMREPALAGHRLIRYHRRGFAGSTPAAGPPDDYIKRAAADAVALLEHLDAQPAHVVGHSSGGLIALELGLDAPELVRSLVLLEPAIVDVPGGREFGRILEPIVERYDGGDATGAVDAFLCLVFGPEWRAEMHGIVPGGPEQADRDAATFFEIEMLAVNAWTLDERRAARISHPVLYVLGSESPAFFDEGRKRVHEWFPQTEDFLASGLNHALQLKDARVMAEAIAGFVGRYAAEKGCWYR